MQVQQRCQELHLDLVETDFAVLLEGCKHGATWGQVSALLQDMTRELTALQPSTIAAAEAFFRSASSLFAFAGAPVWAAGGVCAALGRLHAECTSTWLVYTTLGRLPAECTSTWLNS